LNNKRGNGTTTRSFSWSLDDLDTLYKAMELDGSSGLSSIIQELLTDWVK
jgi:hypothetical protein